MQQFSLNTAFAPSGDQPQAIASLVNGLESGVAGQTLLGVTGSGKTYTIANVIAKVQRPAIVLAPNKTLAAQLYGEMKEFFPKNAVEYFVSYYDYYQPEAYVPASDTYIDKDASINEHIERMRLSATKAVLERRDCIIVASVSAIYGLGDPKQYLSMVLHLDKGDIIDQRKLLRRLAELQYKRNDVDFARATFRVRGDVIDIFPAESENTGIRIELFGDELEQISLFDPLTGKVQQKVPRITIYPKTHYVTPRQRILDTVEQAKKELKIQKEKFLQENRLIEAQRIEERVNFDIEMMLELGYCSGIENYSRYLSGRDAGEAPPTLVDYLPHDVLMVIDESHVTVPQLGAMYKGDRARKENLVNYGFRLPSALDNRPLRFDEFSRFNFQTIYVSATPGIYELEHSVNAIVEQIIRPTALIDPEIIVRPVASQVDDVLSEIGERVIKNERVMITTLTKKMAQDLSDYLLEHNVKARYLHSDIDTVERVEIIRDLRLGVFDVLVGINLLREGLDIPEVSLVAIMDADKEGFLRSERSLIQTIGRAARNVNGKVIMYADTVTKSMDVAITETTRRRILQLEFNKKNNITPKTIIKDIPDIMEGIGVKKVKEKESKAATIVTVPTYKNAKELCKVIDDLERRMHKLALDLEFEQAAVLRDQIAQLQTKLINDA